MNDFKGHDCLIGSDIWSSYGNWESHFLQQEPPEQSLPKDFIVDPSAIGRHSKKASRMEIRRTKDRIRKRILRAKETPLASAIRRENNRRRMAAARARKSMQRKTFHCIQENNPEAVAEASRLTGIAFGRSEVLVDSLSQSNSIFNRERRLPNESAPANLLRAQEMQMQSENLVFSQLQDLHPIELLQNGKIDSKITQTSELQPLITMDDDKKTGCGTIAEDAFYQPLLDAVSFEKKNKISQIKKQVLPPNVQLLNEDISPKCNAKEAMYSGIQILAKNSAILTAIAPPPPPPPPPLQRSKIKMSTDCMPLEATVANKSPNLDNNIHGYQPSMLSTSRTFKTPLFSTGRNQLKRGTRENNGQTDQVASVQNTNALPAMSDRVTITNASAGGVNCMSLLRHRRNTSISIEIRRKRDRLRKQLTRARESQMEKDMRREKNRRRMADFRAHHRLKDPNTQTVTEYETATASAVATAWNPMWEQQWILNEVTPTNEGNNSSNVIHPLESSFLLPKERRTFVVPNHLESFMSNLSSLWKAGRLCDASISNGTAEIMIHKMVLAAVCPKILTELSKTPLDKFQKVTFPNTVSKEALTAFAEYMYSGVLDLDEIILAQLKIIAQRLDMKDFEQLCEGHLQTLQLMTARTGPTIGNELQAAAAVGLQTQVTLQNDIAPIMKQVPVGQNSGEWPNSASNISFPIANPTSNEGMLKIKQELADSATIDNSSKPRVKKEPVTLDDTAFKGSSVRQTMHLLRDQSTRPQRSLPHVESLVSISPLRAKRTNSDPVTACLNSSSTTKVGSSRLMAPNITLHGNTSLSSPHSSSSSSSSSLSSSNSSTSISNSSNYSQTDNSQVNLLSHYVSQTSEAEAVLTKAAAAIASLTSASDVSNSQTMSIKLPSPLSFYNIT